MKIKIAGLGLIGLIAVLLLIVGFIAAMPIIAILGIQLTFGYVIPVTWKSWLGMVLILTAQGSFIAGGKL